MKKVFTLLSLALLSIGTAWANQTDLISGVTLPDIPESTLDLSSQTDYSASAYGWIVETSPKANIGSKTWHSKLATDGGTANWTVPDGCTAPFVSSTGNAFSRYTVRSGARTHAIMFTGAEKASFLGSRNSDTRKTVVSLFSYVGTTQTLIDTKSVDSGSIGELLFEGLTASTTYIAYIYGTDASNNSDWYEFALKAPVTTFTVTYKAGAGSGDDVVDNNAAAVADCPNTFTAPSGKSFYGWNTESNGSGTSYAVGATVTSNLTLYAQWSASHSVTYSLGSGAGTLPTQEDVAEGATFDVAAVPGDLVPPTNKEFKCWNDGTNDYNPGATYTMGTSDVTLTAVYQDITYKGLTPTSTMDFGNPGTAFNSVWTTANNLIQNFYFDAHNGIAVFSAYALYQTKKGAWMDTDSGNSTGDTWDETGNFKGSSYYFSSSARAATVRATERMHYYRVKGITGASAMMGGKAKMEAYLVTAGVVSPDPVVGGAIEAEGALSITGLDTSSEYIIKVYGDNGNSNVQFREIAFSFTAVPSVTIAPAKEYTTYVTSYALDFTGLELKAYVATDATSSAVNMEPVTTVPAGTPLVLKKGSSASYDVPVIVSADAPAVNNLRASDGVSPIGGDGVYDYVLSNGMFYHASAGVLPAGKAYLHYDSAPGARESLEINFEDETTAISSVNRETINNNGYYNLSGQRVAQPTKGLYIVNGKKVIIK